MGVVKGAVGLKQLNTEKEIKAEEEKERTPGAMLGRALGKAQNLEEGKKKAEEEKKK